MTFLLVDSIFSYLIVGNIEAAFFIASFFSAAFTGFGVFELLGGGCDDRVEKRLLVAAVNLEIIEPGMINKMRVIVVKEMILRAESSSESPRAFEVMALKNGSLLAIERMDMLIYFK